MEIGEALKKRAPELILDRDCHKAAVCLLFKEGERGPELVFEQRAARMADQPGDICFPGGMLEPGETPREAALRETCEELGTRPEQVELLGASDYLRTGDVIVYPFAARLTGELKTGSPDEVSEIFTVPFVFFLEHEPEYHVLTLTPRAAADFPFDRIVGGENYRWRAARQDVFFWEYEGRTIWGITAKILKAFIDRIRE